MRLTAIWCHLKNKKPHGKLFRGKHRIVPEPKMEHLVRLRFDFEREERNMFFLRHPYLTSAQENGHMKDFGPKPSIVEKARDMRNEKFQKHFTWADQLVHLRVRDCWE